MGTVLDILNQSLTLCGMRASGETVDAALAQDSLEVLQQLIASWNVESLMIYQIDRAVFPLTTSQTYTVGPGGVFNMVRPVRIERANWRDESQVPALELPLHAMSDQEYMGLRLREMASSMPMRFYYDQAYPVGTFFLYPAPTLTKHVVLWVWHPWDVTAQLATPVDFPPGYARMLVYNLAVELSAQPGARLSPIALKIAEESKSRLENLNAEIPVLALPRGLFGTQNRAGYNYLTDNN
jgi:hypothetical protein